MTTADDNAGPAGDLRDRIVKEAGVQVNRLAAGTRRLGEELGSMATASGQSGLAAELVRQAADSSRGVAEYLEQREPADLLAGLRDVARRRPEAVVVGATLAGMLTGRLLTDGAGVGSTGDGRRGARRRPPSAAESTESSPAGGSFSTGGADGGATIRNTDDEGTGGATTRTTDGAGTSADASGAIFRTTGEADAGGVTIRTTEDAQRPENGADAEGNGRFLSPGQDPGSSGEAPRGYAT